MKVITITNQKGGVGKTTTSVNLAACIANKGFKTLLIDCDYQGNASSALNIQLQAQQDESTLYEVFSGSKQLVDVIYDTPYKNLYCVASDPSLINVNTHFMSRPDGPLQLKIALESIRKNFDYVVVDSRPEMGILWQNSMTAAHYYLVTTFAEADAFDGLNILFENIKFIKSSHNKKLRMLGGLITKYDQKNGTHKKYLYDIIEFLEEHKIPYVGHIPYSNAVSASSDLMIPLIHYKPKLKVSQSYNKLAADLIKSIKADKISGATPKVTKKTILEKKIQLNEYKQNEIGGIDL